MQSFFLNYKNGDVSINTYRSSTAAATDVEDILDAFEEKREESLTASLDLFIEEMAKRIKGIAERCETREELENYLLSEGDYLEELIEQELGLCLADYPELREIQLAQFDYLTFE